MKYLTDIELAIIESAYIECALWSSYDCELDEELGEYELAEQTKVTLLAELHKFLTEQKELIIPFIEKYDAEQVGHSFWLSSNGHGAGFCDFAEGKELEKAASEYKSFDLYLGDDKLVYIV